MAQVRTALLGFKSEDNILSTTGVSYVKCHTGLSISMPMHYVIIKLRIVAMFVIVDLQTWPRCVILAITSTNVPNLRMDSAEQRKIGGYVIPVSLFV